MKSRIIEDFLNHILLERGLSKNTYLNYRRDLKKFYNWTKNKRKDLLQVSLKDLTLFLKDLRNKGYSESSSQRIVSCLKSFFKWTVLHQDIEENPGEFLSLPKKSKRLPEILTLREIELLLSLPNQSSGENILAKRDKALLEFAYATGARATEIVETMVNQLDLEEKFVRILGKGGKERVVPINQHTTLAIEDYITHRIKLLKGKTHSFLFLNKNGGSLSRVGYWKILQKYGKMGGIKHIYPHIIRHSFATHMLQGGCDLRTLQELLGHRSLLTTQIYTHLDLNHLRETIKKCHPRK